MSFAAAPAPPLTFVQGFVAGQVVLFVVLLFVFRYFFVADPPQALEKQRADLIARTRALQNSLDARGRRASSGARVPYERDAAARIEDLLQRTHYDIASHQPETLDWLNLLVAQLIHGYRESVIRAGRQVHENDSDIPLPSLANQEKAAAKVLLERALNDAAAGRTYNLLDSITVTDIDFGSHYPVFSHARFRPAEGGQCLRLEVDFEYRDQISLGIDTRLLINFPQVRFGSLALALCLRIDRLAGTLGIEIGLRSDVPFEARVCLYPDFVLDAHLSSVIGSKSRLYDVPKIEEILISRMRMYIQERLVWPRFWPIRLPTLKE